MCQHATSQIRAPQSNACCRRTLLGLCAVLRACCTVLQLALCRRFGRAPLFRRRLFILLATNIRMTEVFLRLDMIPDPLLQHLSLWEASFGFAIPEKYCLHFDHFMVCYMCRFVLTCRLRIFHKWRKGQRYIEYASCRWDESNLSDGCAERAKEFLRKLRPSQPSHPW